MSRQFRFRPAPEVAVHRRITHTYVIALSVFAALVTVGFASLWVSAPLAAARAVVAANYLVILAGLALLGRLLFAPLGREVADRTRQLDHLRAERSRLTHELAARSREIERMRTELRRLSREDELTGLANRRCLMAYGHTALAAARRERRVLTVLQIDVDRLDAVNTTLGHVAGDALLQALAARLIQACGEADFPARCGGDRFALVVSDAMSPEATARQADRLVQLLSRPIVIDGHAVDAGVSVGVARSDEVDGDFDRLLSRASEALDEARRTGRGRWQRCSAVAAGEPQRQQAVAAAEPLRSALARDAVQPWFVPIVHDGRPESMDVLASWRGPAGERQARHDLPRHPECLPLSDDLLARVVVAGSRAIARWQAAGYALQCVTIPVDLQQLRRADFAARLVSLLSEFGAAPGSVALEVNDGELAALPLADESVLHGNFEALRRGGILTTLTNVASIPALKARLAYLRPDRVKFTAAFTATGTTGPDPALVQQISLAQEIAAARHITVIAQGVHDEAQARRLAHLGIVLQQGPLYADAMDRSLASAWLRERRALGRRDAA